MKDLHSNCRLLLVNFLLLALVPGCALTRSSSATNVEDEEEISETPESLRRAQLPTVPPAISSVPSRVPAQPLETAKEGDISDKPEIDTAPAPQKVQALPKSTTPTGTNPKIAAASNLFHHALKEQTDAAFSQAATLWQEYLQLYPGMPGFDNAHYNLGLCLYYLGRPVEAEQILRSLLESSWQSASDSPNEGYLAVDVRILLAETLIQIKKLDEALALTFEIYPDRKAEAEAGLKRSAKALNFSHAARQPDPVQQVKIYTLRGRIFSSLGNETAARKAIAQARLALGHIEKHQSSSVHKKTLTAHVAWREIEIEMQSCRNQVRVPERLSEAEFLAYASAYYGCTDPARRLFCEVLAAGDQQVTSQALVAYKVLVETPLEVRDHLPPPARLIRKQEQRGPYEREMKALIEKTVREHSEAYKNLEACMAFDIF